MYQLPALAEEVLSMFITRLRLILRMGQLSRIISVLTAFLLCREIQDLIISVVESELILIIRPAEELLMLRPDLP